MLKDIYSVVDRIDEIKKRFGLKRHNIYKYNNFQNVLNNNIDNLKKDKISNSNNDKTVTQMKEIAQAYAVKNSVPASLVNAIISTESNFNPNAVSSKGAAGLMQLMPGLVKELGISDPFNIDENINGGVTHFRRLLDKYNWDYKLALAAYNAGEGAVEKNNGIPPYKETQQYIKKVIKSYIENI